MNNCIYCLHSFSTKYYLVNIHSQKCKSRDDPVRLLEIKLNVQLDNVPDNHNQCRFCNKIFSDFHSKIRHLPICKKRKDYHQQLLSNNINSIGNESVTHFNTENVIDLLRQIRIKKDLTGIQHIATSWIHQFGQLLRTPKQNQNWFIKSRYGSIYNGSTWDRSTVNNTLDSVILVDSKKLVNLYNDINELNDKVFNNKTNKDVFDHIKLISIHGIGITDRYFIRNLYRFGIQQPIIIRNY